MAAQEKKVIGLKQSMRAIEQDEALMVYIAKDANSALTTPVIELCNEKNIAVKYTETSRELGLVNGISVCATVVCIMK